MARWKLVPFTMDRVHRRADRLRPGQALRRQGRLAELPRPVDQRHRARVRAGTSCAPSAASTPGTASSWRSSLATAPRSSWPGPRGSSSIWPPSIHSKGAHVSSPNGAGSDAPPRNPIPGIQRLLFVADAAVAGVDELPPVVRAMIDAAAHVDVLTPSLPGRLAWLADDVDRFRHYADERFDTVLSQLRAVGADAGGALRRGSVLTVIADAVTAFEPD